MTFYSVDEIRAATPLGTLLNQEKTWVDAEGTAWLLEEMDPRHRLNVLNLLTRSRASLAMREAIEHLAGPLAARGDIAAADEADYLAERDVDEWFNRLPLIRRLRALCDVEEPF